MATTLDTVRRDLRYYAKGVYSRSETSVRLICAAADCRPEDLVELMPGEWVESIRESTKVLPKSSEDVYILRSYCLFPGGDQDHEARDAAARKEWFDGATQWHRYFATSRKEDA